MCEDIVQWKEKGLAIMTCDSNRRKWNTVMVFKSYFRNAIDVGSPRRSKSERTVDLG